MKKIFSVMMFILGIIFYGSSLNQLLAGPVSSEVWDLTRGAGGFAGAFNVNDPSLIPLVPEDVMIKGGQYVIANLLDRVDHVSIYYYGRSLIENENKFMSREALRHFGYIHNGSSVELMNALANVAFDAEVIKTPDGVYDVQVDVVYWTSEDTVAFTGHGNPYLQEGRGGDLTADTFNVWMSVNSKVAIPIDFHLGEAKWVSENGSGDADLNITYRPSGEKYNGPALVIDHNMLGSGHLIYTYNGRLTGINLRDGSKLDASRALAVLGSIQARSIFHINLTTKEADLSSIHEWSDIANFYRSADGKVYGRIPVIDLNAVFGINTKFSPKFEIWGSSPHSFVVPKRIFVKPTSIGRTTVDAKRFAVGYYTELDKGADGWDLNLPPGTYHIIMEFEGVLDWDLDPNPVG